MCKEYSDDRLEQERELAAEISFKIGKYMEERDGRNIQDAITAFNDCLSRNENHLESLTSLAKIFQGLGQND
jgi:hypothetical protein